MIEQAFADTNLFLRYFTDDVPDQADAVEDLLDRASREELELITTVMAVAETVWTLESFYKLSRFDIQEKVFALLNTAGLFVEEADRVLQATVWYVEKNVDFIDAYHAAWIRDQKLKRIHTFDKNHFQRFDHLDVIVPGST